MSESSDRAEAYRMDARMDLSRAEQALNTDNWSDAWGPRDLRVQSLALIALAEAALAIAETLSGVVFVQDAGRE